MNELIIGQGVQVTMHFSLSLESGEVIDSNFEGEPVTFTVGDGNLLPGFETALFGLKQGDETALVVPPERGFGEHNPENVQVIERMQFPADADLQPGLMLTFSDAQNNELPGVVTDISDESVTVDFNHPLAGRDVRFTVKIIEVEPAITH